MAEKPIQVTLKMGAGYDCPWTTVSGEYAEVEANLTKIIEGTLGEVIAEASQRLQGAFLLIGQSKMSGGVGAKTMKDARAKAKTTAKDTTPTAEENWASSHDNGVEQAPTEELATEGENPLIAAINAATTKAQLGDIWAKNQVALKDPALMDVMKARSASLAQK